MMSLCMYQKVLLEHTAPRIDVAVVAELRGVCTLCDVLFVPWIRSK